jgi:hypothetical protein
VFRGELDRAVHEGKDVTTPRWKTPAGDDFQRLRGLPAVAPGVRGVQPGIDPLRAVIAKESYREKRR